MCSFSAQAQSTFGSIRGAVADSTGASVPGTAVTLHSTDENTDRAVTTDVDGTFLFSNIKPGHFSLGATHAGFSPTALNGITLDARQDLRLPVVLSVAAQTTTIEVSAAADEINTESGTISDSKSNTLITQLPLNNRATTTSPLGALTLSPNVQQDSQGNIALGGASSSMVNFSVDGISTANVRQNGPLADAYPSQEGIAAVKVTDFNNNAEFSQVGDVTFTTKSGSNQYHGSVFEYFQNDVLDASPYGFSGKAPKNFNTFGGSVSGAVSIPHLYNGKNRTFFFADYEGNRRRLSVSEQYVVPTQQQRMGLLAGLVDANGNQVADVPQSNLNPTALALLNGYYPLPNVQNAAAGSFNYETFAPTPASTDGADLRVDQTIGSKQSLYARVSRKNILENFVNPLLPNDEDSVHNRSLLVSYTTTFTAHLLNEFRFGLTDATTGVNFAISGASALQQLDLQGVNISQHPLTHAFPTFNFSNGTGFQPIGRDKTGVTQSKTYEFTDNLTYTLGEHTFKAGTDIRRVRYFDIETFQPSDDFGSFTFQPTSGPATCTGTQPCPGQSAFGEFLQGTPTTLFFAVSSPDVGGDALQSSFFVQDEWQVSHTLTLSYGLRYQILPPFIEDGGNLANFDERSNAIVVPNGLAGYLQTQKIQASNLGFQQSFNACTLNQNQLPCTQYLTASQDHLSQGLRRTYKGNVQPRISFAYRPFNNDKTVVRGGFGVYTMTNLGPLSFNNSGNPTSALHTYTNGPGLPLIQFPNTAPPTSGVQYGGGNLDQGVDPNYRDPQANQFSFTIERELTANTSLRTSFVGMHTYRLSVPEDLNQIHASTTPYDTGATAGVYVDSRAPYQNWNELYSTFNAGKANYEAFETEVSHRMTHGLYYDANYTLAKNLADNQGDNPSGFAGEVNYGIPIADRFNIPGDYGNVEGTRRNRFLLTGIVQAPFGTGRKYLNSGGIVDRLLGGWDLNTVTLLESGPLLTPSISASADQSNTNVANRGAFARPDQVSNNFTLNRSRAQYFNVAAFQPTPAGAGRFGNAGVGSLEGPGTKTVGFGVAKNFKITETSYLRFESTFTNIFNHTNFAPPPTQIDNSTFGQLTAATTAENAGNRTGQFALRYDFWPTL
ncbi:MAG: carboxypeptidase-like regulatory domain-containing protein [Janthinobacterium lividum]